MSYQRVIIVGNLGRDPELRYTTTDKAVANFPVAVNEGSGDKQSTEWFNCVAWEKAAESIGEFFRKGDPILIEGRMKTDTYTDKDGHERKAPKLIVGMWRFVGPKADREGAERPQGASKPAGGSQPKARPAQAPAKPSEQAGMAFDDMDDDIPF